MGRAIFSAGAGFAARSFPAPVPRVLIRKAFQKSRVCFLYTLHPAAMRAARQRAGCSLAGDAASIPCSLTWMRDRT